MKIVILVLIISAGLNAGAAVAYEAKGSAIFSNGNCRCKAICDNFDKAGQLPCPRLAQCKSNCQQKYAGCNTGALG